MLADQQRPFHVGSMWARSLDGALVGTFTLRCLYWQDTGNSEGVRAKCLEGQGDLVNRLIIGVTRVTIWVIGVTNLLTKSP